MGVAFTCIDMNMGQGEDGTWHHAIMPRGYSAHVLGTRYGLNLQGLDCIDISLTLFSAETTASKYREGLL